MIGSVCGGTWHGSRRLMQASTCRRHILAIKNRVCIIIKWIVSGMWQSRLVTSWVGLCRQIVVPVRIVCLFWPHPLLAISNKQLPATTEAQKTVSACVSFLTASEPSGKRDTCSDAHRVSADCVRLFWPRRPASVWKMGRMTCSDARRVKLMALLWLLRNRVMACQTFFLAMDKCAVIKVTKCTFGWINDVWAFRLYSAFWQAVSCLSVFFAAVKDRTVWFFWHTKAQCKVAVSMSLGLLSR